jgi:crossover junction endodeoxyribonuclease RuvC
MLPAPIRIIGIDPGLRTTGWGIIEAQGSRLSFVACGCVRSDDRLSTAERLRQLH